MGYCAFHGLLRDIRFHLSAFLRSGILTCPGVSVNRITCFHPFPSAKKEIAYVRAISAVPVHGTNSKKKKKTWSLEENFDSAILSVEGKKTFSTNRDSPANVLLFLSFAPFLATRTVHDRFHENNCLLFRNSAKSRIFPLFNQNRNKESCKDTIE